MGKIGKREKRKIENKEKIGKQGKLSKEIPLKLNFCGKLGEFWKSTEGKKMTLRL